MALPTRPRWPAINIRLVISIECLRRLQLVKVVGGEAVLLHQGVALSRREILGDHLLHQLAEGNAWNPSQLPTRLGSVAQQGFDFGGTEVAWVDGDNKIALGVVGLLVDSNTLPA